MLSVFISKVAKLLNLNPFENPMKYQRDILFNELGMYDITHFEVFKPAYFELPEIKITDFELTKKQANMKSKTDYTNHNNCNFGIYNERKVISHLNKHFKIDRQQEAVMYPITDKFKLYGKIDGYLNDTLIEIKSRRNNFIKIKYFEMIQLQLYMLASGDNDCVFIESYNDKLKAYKVEFNSEYIGVIMKQIKFLIEHLIYFCNERVK